MRRKITYTVYEQNRDKGKSFQITEMAAAHAEEWAIRAILAISQSEATIPVGFELSQDWFAKFGMSWFAEEGLKALSSLKWDVLKELLDEMFECVKVLPNPAQPNFVRDLIPEDTEEVSTRLTLRNEVWKLHLGFFTHAGA